MYQTDLTETEWQYITKVLNLQERKRKYDLRLIWNAIFYLVKTGCQWRMLPLDFPKWQLVYYYYRKWASQLDFDLWLEKLRGHVRVKRGQSMAPSVKNILADGGYRGELVDNIRKKFGYVIQVVISTYKKLGFRPIQKRWIVERTFSWMDDNRKLCRNYELTFDSAEEMVKLATIRLLLRKI